MKIKNNNNKIINKIILRSLRINKQRNIFTIIGILLTSTLLTAVITMSLSLNASMERSKMRQIGTSAHGSLKYLSNEEYNILKKHPSIKKFGSSIYVSEIENGEFKGFKGEIRTMDENYAKWGFAKPYEGHIPQEYNELMAASWALEVLGVEPKIGNKVVLEFSADGEKRKEDFIISGIYKGDKFVASATSFVVSEDYANELFKGLTQDKIKSRRELGNVLGTRCLDIMFDSPVNIYNKLKKITDDYNITMEEKRYGVSWAYTSASLDLSIIIPAIGFILLVVISGYLLIYNVFYISIIKDIRFYGMLKTIGTTKKQIRKIVIRQGMILSAIGIPIGLLFGHLIGGFIMPMAISSSNIREVVVSADYKIFLSSMIFTLATVYLSCYKPSKIAGKVSPIEATKYTESKILRKKGVKKSRNGMKISKMAFSNIFRNRKKAIIVITSLSSSVILFLTVFQFINSFSIDEFVKHQIQSDFIIADQSYYEYRAGQADDGVSNKLYDELNGIKGIENINKIYLQRAEDNSLNKEKFQKIIQNNIDANEDEMFIKSLKQMTSVDVQIYGYSDLLFQKMNKDYVIKGEIDIEKLKTGDYIVIYQSETNDIYDVGEKLKIDLPDGNTKEFQVMALVNYMYASDVQSFDSVGYKAYVPIEIFEKLIENPYIMQVQIDAEKDKLQEVNKEINKVVKDYKRIVYKSRNDYIDEFRNFTKTYSTIGYLLSSVIGIIGILNLVNTILTSIIVRKQEFAMMESIGMSRKQLYKMLIYEGFWYAILTCLIISTLGVLIIYILLNILGSSISAFENSINIASFILSYTVIIFTCLLATICCYRTNVKGSIIERLRTIES